MKANKRKCNEFMSDKQFEERCAAMRKMVSENIRAARRKSRTEEPPLVLLLDHSQAIDLGYFWFPILPRKGELISGSMIDPNDEGSWEVVEVEFFGAEEPVGSPYIVLTVVHHEGFFWKHARIRETIEG